MQDKNGEDLDIGDRIVYAFVSGSVAYLRIGTIKEFVDKKAEYGNRWTHKMKVEWEDTESVFVSPGNWNTVPKTWISLVEHADRALKL